MQNTYDLSDDTLSNWSSKSLEIAGDADNAWSPKPLVAGVGIGLALVVIGTILALGLGIGLHGTEGNNGNLNLTIIIASTTTTTAAGGTTTTTTTSTTSTTTSTSTTTTTTTTTATTTILISVNFQGNLTNSSALFNSLSSTALNYSYDATDVTVGTSGNYTLQSSSTTNYTFYGYLYNNSFSAFSPFTNLLARTDGVVGGSSQFSITYNLLFGVEYVLVVTSINQTANSTVPAFYTIISTGPGTTTFVHRTPVTVAVVYGTVSNSGTDGTSNGRVQINAQDVITGVDGVSTMGYVDLITVSFSIAPNTTTPMVFLYVLNQTSALVFTSTIVYQIPYASITTGVTGIQNISLPFDQLPVVSGQYVGIGLGTSGGSLYSVPGRSQYYLSGVTNFGVTGSSTYLTATTGFAFSFRVQVAGVVFR